MSEIKLKDFILTDIPEPEKKETKQNKRTEYVFTVEYENDTDFILRRVTDRTDRSLVVIVSQGQVYIKDNKNDKIENVINKDQLQKFRSGMKDSPKFEKLTWTPFWTYNYWSQGRYQDVIKLDDCFERLIYHKESFKILSNKKLNPFKDENIVYRYERDPEGFNKEKEYLSVLHLFDDAITTGSWCYDSMVSNIRKINLQTNTIKPLLNIINEIGANKMIEWFRNDRFSIIFTEYLVDFKTFLSYILYTIKYRNGLDSGWAYYNEFQFSDYIDYLRMQKEMYGKVKEKYPQYWLSEKQMMNKKYNAWNEMRKILGFNLGQEELQKYEYNDETFKVIIPLKSTDILDEAEQQQHCVASYIDRIKRGDTHILFIRYNDTPEESLLTVEVTPDGRIVQVRGFMNRRYTHAEWDFMNEWAKEKDLKLEVAEPNEEV